MKKRLHNPNRAKINRNYTVEDVAVLYDVHKVTVREWIKHGLPTINDKRPMPILGSELAAFHQARRTKNKRKCKPGEIYCVKCRAPKMPDGEVEYQPKTATLGNLTSNVLMIPPRLCPTLGGQFKPGAAHDHIWRDVIQGYCVR